MTAWLDDFRAAANIWLQPVCALAVPDTSVGARLVAHGSDIHERDLTYAMQRKRQLKRA